MNDARKQPEPEVWAGIEGTVNRVGDVYFDQCFKNGHSTEDLVLFKELGIRRIRYPALWENIAPTDPSRPDWSAMDARMAALQELNLVPIIGLLHHGSGPRYTSLADPDFPRLFADYALQFASRYPWVMHYTPINEPLTTARFSGLYGYWYPHARDDLTFLRILLNQLRATVLAVEAIRSVNPSAEFIQTEDLGKATSTQQLIYQAAFENNRRWLTWDILCGHLGTSHPLWTYFIKSGIPEGELAWFLENTCPPDIIGINHYLLSNRFLDHRVHLYPEQYRGGNQREAYADLGAVDCLDAVSPSPYEIFKEVWERYQLPLAVTEVHLNGHRESQMRWFHEIWGTAKMLRKLGCDVRAVTAWSLLGSFDWDSLCTACNDHYEPGVFDVRAPRPRPTGMARMIKALGHGQAFDHPLLGQAGWWHDPSQKLYPFRPDPPKKPRFKFKAERPILITGGKGTLGRAFATIAEKRGIPYHLLGRNQMDIAERESVLSVFKDLNPWAVINAAGYVKVDLAETEPERCYRDNVIGAEVLALACAAADIPIITFSSDLVFDGTLNSPYCESHCVSPLNVYGRSKAEAEKRVLKSHDGALIIRTSSFFGPWDRYNFVVTTLERISQGGEVIVPEDITISPTYVPDLVHASLDLLVDCEKGIWHLTNEGAITWADLARLAADLGKKDSRRIIGGRSHECGNSAPRPVYSALRSEKASLMPPIHQALERFFCDFKGG